MNANKPLTLAGLAIAIALGGAMHRASAGIDGGGAPGTSKGTVTAFGSVYVNGARFATDNALFIIDGEFGQESDLEIGQVVSVYGTRNGDSGVAWVVTYDDLVEGPISAIDLNAGSATILGQTVLIDPETAFAGGASLEDFGQNDSVEVSGFVDADGNVVATYFGASSADTADVTGTIESVDESSMTFTVNDLEVDYSDANLFDLDGGSPTVGSRVEILGTPLDGNTIKADQVAPPIEGIDGGGGDSVNADVEGLVSDRRSWMEFDIGGTPVRIGWRTAFVNGSFFSLAENRKVEVQGAMNSAGVLVADRVEFERSADTQVGGRVDAVYGDSVLVGGILVRVTTETSYEDDSDQEVRRFTAVNLSVGDTIEVNGFEDGGAIVATRLERHNDRDDDYDYDGQNFDD
ncbi:MAG: DUF5666 domain-containing protein [Woeseiaceae bacterium]|nr:DUF5666 domain-containing protein [Woeseiaceae bacterium]